MSIHQAQLSQAYPTNTLGLDHYIVCALRYSKNVLCSTRLKANGLGVLNGLETEQRF